MFWTAINVGKARAKYEVKAPATSGHEMFDRAHRIQMNTLEIAMLPFPSIWVNTGFMESSTLSGEITYYLAQF
jgi:glutathione S-transferase